jgi:hypothetical protein
MNELQFRTDFSAKTAVRAGDEYFTKLEFHLKSLLQEAERYHADMLESAEAGKLSDAADRVDWMQSHYRQTQFENEAGQVLKRFWTAVAYKESAEVVETSEGESA